MSNESLPGQQLVTVNSMHIYIAEWVLRTSSRISYKVSSSYQTKGNADIYIWRKIHY